MPWASVCCCCLLWITRRHNLCCALLILAFHVGFVCCFALQCGVSYLIAGNMSVITSDGRPASPSAAEKRRARVCCFLFFSSQSQVVSFVSALSFCCVLQEAERMAAAMSAPVHLSLSLFDCVLSVSTRMMSSCFCSALVVDCGSCRSSLALTATGTVSFSFSFSFSCCLCWLQP